jgi:hypothetical protein
MVIITWELRECSKRNATGWTPILAHRLAKSSGFSNQILPDFMSSLLWRENLPVNRALIAYTCSSLLSISYMRPLVLVAASGGKTYPVDKDFLVVGRQDICDVHIDHKSVSKQHCVLLRRGGKLWLRDLGSTNGSHVNGRRVRRAPLKVKDVLGVGGFAFKVCYADAAKSKVRDPGTKKLNPDELRRIQMREPVDAQQVSDHGPVVQVNTLPDEFTPVTEGDE